MPPLLQLQKLQGKGDGGWKKSVFALFFGWPEDREFVEKKCFGASKTSYCLLPDTFWLRASKNVFKVGSVKFANSLLSTHRLPLWRKYVPEVKAAKVLKQCRAKVKGVNNPAWTAQYLSQKLKSKNLPGAVFLKTFYSFHCITIVSLYQCMWQNLSTRNFIYLFEYCS